VPSGGGSSLGGALLSGRYRPCLTLGAVSLSLGAIEVSPVSSVSSPWGSSPVRLVPLAIVYFCFRNRSVQVGCPRVHLDINLDKSVCDGTVV